LKKSLLNEIRFWPAGALSVEVPIPIWRALVLSVNENHRPDFMAQMKLKANNSFDSISSRFVSYLTELTTRFLMFLREALRHAGAHGKSCRWLKLRLVAQIEFIEWTPDGHLRHSSYAGLRDDKEAREVGRE